MEVIRIAFLIGLLASANCVDLFRTQFEDMEDAVAYQASRSDHQMRYPAAYRHQR